MTDLKQNEDILGQPRISVAPMMDWTSKILFVI